MNNITNEIFLSLNFDEQNRILLELAKKALLFIVGYKRAYDISEMSIKLIEYYLNGENMPASMVSAYLVKPAQHYRIASKISGAGCCSAR